MIHRISKKWPAGGPRSCRTICDSQLEIVEMDKHWEWVAYVADGRISGALSLVCEAGRELPESQSRFIVSTVWHSRAYNKLTTYNNIREY